MGSSIIVNAISLKGEPVALAVSLGIERKNVSRLTSPMSLSLQQSDIIK